MTTHTLEGQSVSCDKASSLLQDCSELFWGENNTLGGLDIIEASRSRCGIAPVRNSGSHYGHGLGN